ncbi:MAG: hypothetical protein ACUVRE_02195 [Thermoanaerobaculaceae bacterium]
MSWLFLLAVAFSQEKVVPLASDPGWIAYVVTTPQGLVLSTKDVIQAPQEQKAKVLLVSWEGKTVAERDVEALGFARLTNIAWTGQELLVADFSKGTLLILDGKLEKKREVLLKGSHPYPYYPRFLAFAPQGQKLLVTGCYPLRVYLDTGCLQLHEYTGPDFHHLASSLESLPPREEWKYDPVSQQYVVGVLPGGEVWVVEEAAGKGFHRREGGQWQALDFGAFAFKPPAFPKSAKDLESALAKAYLATGIFPLSQGKVAVAYASQEEQKSRVIVFSSQGKALRQEELPGRVVGENEGQLIAASRTSSWQLSFWRLK